MAQLAQSPLSGLLLTLLAYQIAQMLYKKMGQPPWLHPVLWSALAIAVFLRMTGFSYEAYWKGAQFIHFLLGPATVALAFPLYQQWPTVKRSWKAVLGASLTGSIAGFGSALLLAWLLHIPREHWSAIAPKSATTPIAMSITEKIGGDPGLAVIFVVITGIFGSMAGAAWLKLLRIKDERAIGLALGVAAHGIGTARAVQISETCAAFAGLGMGLCGLFTAILLPILL